MAEDAAFAALREAMAQLIVAHGATANVQAKAKISEAALAVMGAAMYLLP